jgi:ribosome biogenesis GTPase
MMSPRSYDEGDVRIRPKRSKPPRSKDRPDYSALPIAFVITVDRGRITCILDSGQQVTAMKARELGKNAVVVGDQIRLAGDVSGREGTLARAVEVMARQNYLARTVDDIGAVEKIVVSNVDQLVIVIAAANPEPRHGFVARALAVAFDQGIRPIIVITKCDLANPDEFLLPYAALDIEVIKSFIIKAKVDRAGDENSGAEELSALLKDKTSVLIGHSGVGKSTLVNRLVGSDQRATGDVNDATGRGRHTSSSAHGLRLPTGGWIIDTPGIRSFGLEHLDISRVIGSFADLAPLIANCPKLCSHNEQGCALNDIPESSDSYQRVVSLRRLLADSGQPIA